MSTKLGPFSESLLTELAEAVIEQQDALDHEEATGKTVLFIHHDIKMLHTPQPVSGRGGDFYKFSFEYEIEVIEEDFPDEPYRARFSRNVRMDANGRLTAIGARTLLAELD